MTMLMGTALTSRAMHFFSVDYIQKKKVIDEKERGGRQLGVTNLKFVGALRGNLFQPPILVYYSLLPQMFFISNCYYRLLCIVNPYK